jgi:hypothetical protein
MGDIDNSNSLESFILTLSGDVEVNEFFFHYRQRLRRLLRNNDESSLIKGARFHRQEDCLPPVFTVGTGQKNDRSRAAPRAVLSGFLLLLKMSDLI